MAGNIKERYINPSRDITNAIETAKKEAKEEGLAEGILAVARKMKELGLPIEQISNATNLPTDQIEKL